MNIKQPVAYDTSYWESIPDMAAINPRPLFVATRATLGPTYTDPTFVRYFTDLGYDNIRRGAYHAFKHGYDPKQQAYHFISVVEPYVTEKDVLELDFEGGNETAAELLIWLNQVRARYPNNLIMVYSRKNLADPIARTMTATQKAQMRTYPFWCAGYPANPDGFNAPPADYIPDQSAFGKVWMWQYSDQAIVDGIKGEVDVNWLSMEFQQFLGTVVTPTDVTTPLYDGVIQITGERNGWRWWLHICDPAKVRYEVFNPAYATVSQTATHRGAQLAWNGSDYNRVTRELHMGSPSFYESGDVRNDTFGDVYGVRPLITDGNISLRLYQGDAAATEGHSRCCFGKTADGHVMHFVSEGAYPNQGLRLSDCAEIMKQYGAIIAADAGGGGDTALVIEGELQNIPEDIDGGVHVERRIPQVLLAYVQQEGNTMNGTAKEILGNTTTVRNEPSRYGADSGSKLPAGGTVEFVEIVPVVVKGVADNRDDKWLKLPNGKYINYILAGREYYHVLTMPTTDTPAPAEKMANVHLVITDDEGFSATVDVDVVMVKA